MPNLSCACGFVHDLSRIPDDGWMTVRDVDYEPLHAFERERDRLRAESARDEAFAPADRAIQNLHGLMYECPSCGRLLWQRPGEVEFRSYARERLEKAPANLPILTDIDGMQRGLHAMGPVWYEFQSFSVTHSHLVIAFRAAKFRPIVGTFYISDCIHLVGEPSGGPSVFTVELSNDENQRAIELRGDPDRFRVRGLVGAFQPGAGPHAG